MTLIHDVLTGKPRYIFKCICGFGFREEIIFIYQMLPLYLSEYDRCLNTYSKESSQRPVDLFYALYHIPMCWDIHVRNFEIY